MKILIWQLWRFIYHMRRFIECEEEKKRCSTGSDWSMLLVNRALQFKISLENFPLISKSFVFCSFLCELSSPFYHFFCARQPHEFNPTHCAVCIQTISHEIHLAQDDHKSNTHSPIFIHNTILFSVVVHIRVIKNYLHEKPTSIWHRFMFSVSLHISFMIVTTYKREEIYIFWKLHTQYDEWNVFVGGG